MKTLRLTGLCILHSVLSDPPQAYQTGLATIGENLERGERREGGSPCQTHMAGVSEPGFLIVFSQLAFLPLENGAVSQDNMGRSCGLGR